MKNTQKTQIMDETYTTKNELMVDLVSHLVISTALSLLVLSYTKSFLLSVLCFFGGVFIDLDHVIDYFIHFGITKGFNLKKFFSVEYLDSGKSYIFFHSFELVMLLFAYSFSRGQKWILALALGMGAHLATDCITNRKMGKQFYFFLFRLVNNFDLDKMAPGVYEQMKRRKNGV